MTQAAATKLVFVYNADSGVFNLLTDVAHKIFSPQTYACNLCALTHSNFGMKKEWKEFLDSLEEPLEFLHADEFRSGYRSEHVKLPAIFVESDGTLEQLVTAEEINACRSMGDLKRLIEGARRRRRGLLHEE